MVGTNGKLQNKNKQTQPKTYFWSTALPVAEEADVVDAIGDGEKKLSEIDDKRTFALRLSRHAAMSSIAVTLRCTSFQPASSQTSIRGLLRIKPAKARHNEKWKEKNDKDRGKEEEKRGELA